MSRLPGDIEGLKQDGTPLVCTLDGRELTAVQWNGRAIGVQPRIRGIIPADAWAIDLRVKTGRAHAAWWAMEHGPGEWDMVTYVLLYDACLNRATEDMTPDQIETLRRLVLRLAGREET